MTSSSDPSTCLDQTLTQIRNPLPAHLHSRPLSLHSPSAIQRRRNGKLPLRRVGRNGHLLCHFRSLHHINTLDVFTVILLQRFVQITCSKTTSPRSNHGSLLRHPNPSLNSETTSVWLPVSALCGSTSTDTKAGGRFITGAENIKIVRGFHW